MAFNTYQDKLSELKKQLEEAGKEQSTGAPPTAEPEKTAGKAPAAVSSVPVKSFQPSPIPSGPPRNPVNTAPPPRSGSYPPPGSGQLPGGYLKQGYFDSSGHIFPELLVEQAREIARIIGMRQDRAEGIKNAQLRRFYGHVKTAESRLNYGVSFADIRPKILELSAFVAEAQGKGKVPLVFKEFMDLNLERVVDGPSFRNGFVKHFQAVVGFFSFYYRD